MFSAVCLGTAVLVATCAALNPSQLIQGSELGYDGAAESLAPEPNGELPFDVLAMHASQQMERFDALRLSGRVPAEDSIGLLTTIFLGLFDHRRSHEREVLAAFAVNVANPLISAVHVLLEAHPKRIGGDCSGLRGLLEDASSREVPQFHKVICVQVTERPMYGDLFTYADTRMPVGRVIISNADVVYDETLAQLPELEEHVGVHLLSIKPPPYEGAFKEVFGHQCPKEPYGTSTSCLWHTRSWDAYVFRTPLPANLTESHNLQFPMSWMSSEFYMASALLDSGMKLTNPCMFVHAYHWHCFGDKMHATFDKSKLPPIKNKYTSFPCKDFPSESENGCHGWH
mmetsp:Transcript_96394/g.251210  ORF Transcript_96394/g.251210 Transcript_96394/m.251210 type:complete len:342 (-) Transcript_96394:39-1064(-)